MWKKIDKVSCKLNNHSEFVEKIILKYPSITAHDEDWELRFFASVLEWVQHQNCCSTSFFFVNLDRSIGIPRASTGYGEWVWCKISQSVFSPTIRIANKDDSGDVTSTSCTHKFRKRVVTRKNSTLLSFHLYSVFPIVFMVGSFLWKHRDALDLKNIGKNTTFSNLNIHDKIKFYVTTLRILWISWFRWFFAIPTTSGRRAKRASHNEVSKSKKGILKVCSCFVLIFSPNGVDIIKYQEIKSIHNILTPQQIMCWLENVRNVFLLDLRYPACCENRIDIVDSAVICFEKMNRLRDFDLKLMIHTK